MFHQRLAHAGKNLFKVNWKGKKTINGCCFGVFFSDFEQTFANTFCPKLLCIAKANDTIQYSNSHWTTSQWRFNIVMKYQNLSFTCLILDSDQDFVLIEKSAIKCFTKFGNNEPISSQCSIFIPPKNVFREYQNGSLAWNGLRGPLWVI